MTRHDDDPRARAPAATLGGRRDASRSSLLPLGGAVAAHGPDPFFSGGPFGQNQDLRFRWRAGAEPTAAIKTAITAAAADANASRGSKAATFTYDAAGANPIGYGLGATCGVNGLACFTRTAPTGFTMWLREQGHVFDWGTLKWCQAYSHGAERLLRRRDDRARRVRARRGPRPPRQLRRRLGLPGRRRPDLLADQAGDRLERPRVPALRRRDPPAPVRHGLDDREVLDLPGPGDGPDLARRRTVIRPGGTTTLTATLKVADLRRLRRARRQPGLRPDGDAPAPRPGADDVDDRRDDAGRDAPGPTSSRSGRRRTRTTAPSSRRRPTRASNGTRRRPSTSTSATCPPASRRRRRIAVPCI